ncbi:exopolysaccharide biosynthesis polyprenyl glycosylphosphotransferase [Lachnospiraceae bacterium]|nr:exopolysaccharide biosynthesis polyprenyl glycosylphosphotransferase [Lachnospiraceae bacterium]
MYKKNSNSLIKHLDFIVIDIILLCFAFWLAYVVRHRAFNMFDNSIYLSYTFIIILLALVAGVMLRTYKSILYRGYGVEFRKVFTFVSFVFVGVLFLSFLQKETTALSRTSVVLFYLFSILLVYVGRVLRKRYLIKRIAQTDKREVILVADFETAEKVINKIYDRGIVDFSIKGIVAFDNNDSSKSIINSKKIIQGIPIIATDREGTFEYIEKNVVDEIIFAGLNDNREVNTLIEECEMIGLTVHIVIDQIDSLMGETAVEKMAGVPVLSSTIRLVSSSDMLLKRIIDILGSTVGLIFTGILFIFVAPAIYISDPGPIFFSQDRIGKNGRVFKIYKFRSMYMDAEKRKAELMSKNEMQGLMFKMENDPRIIGSGPDGSRKSVGWVIRTFSIDEFPQFWNVFKGDMSLVGTRPPTVDEWEQYDIYHKIRMRIKPGLTGLWQVSGRSNITDFEEVVRLDSEYIRSWSMWNDLKIILQTVKVVFYREGSK